MDDYELFDIPYEIDDLQAWEEERVAEDVRLEQGDEQVTWAQLADRLEVLVGGKGGLGPGRAAVGRAHDGGVRPLA